MSMRLPRKRVPHKGGPMTRQVLIVVGAAILSVGGFAVVLEVVRLVLRLVLGVFPYILESRIQMLSSVIPALFVLVAFVGAATAAVFLANRERKKKADHDPAMHSNLHA
jgi:hypothetical protein